MRSPLRIASAMCVTVCFAAGALLVAQAPAPRKRLLVIGEEKGYRHEAVTHAMVTLARLGKETGLWDTALLRRSTRRSGSACRMWATP
jgi:hypothetical protein